MRWNLYLSVRFLFQINRRSKEKPQRTWRRLMCSYTTQRSSNLRSTLIVGLHPKLRCTEHNHTNYMARVLRKKKSTIFIIQDFSQNCQTQRLLSPSTLCLLQRRDVNIKNTRHGMVSLLIWRDDTTTYTSLLKQNIQAWSFSRSVRQFRIHFFLVQVNQQPGFQFTGWWPWTINISYSASFWI